MYFPHQSVCYLVVVVGSSAGVQAGEKSLGLLLHTGGGWHGQEESGQLQSCSLILLLCRSKDMQSTKQTRLTEDVSFTLAMTSRAHSPSVYLFTGRTDSKAAFQSLEGADHQPEILKKDD